MAIALVRTVYVATALGPELLGSWALMLLILEYMNYANLGVFSSMNRDVAIHIDKADKQKEITKLMGNAISLTMIIFTLILLSLMGLYYFPAQIMPPEFYEYYAFLIIMIALYQLKQFLNRYLRLYDKLYQFAVLEFLAQLIMFAVILLSVEEYTIYGVMFSVLLSNIFYLFFGFFYVKGIRLSLDFDTAKYLIFQGFPMMLYGVFVILSISIDRMFIASAFDSRAPLGLYQIAYTLTNGLFIVFNALTVLFYPKWLHHFNESNENKSSIIKSINDQSDITELFLVILSLIGISFVGFFINLFAPEYKISILITQILLLAFAVHGKLFFALTYLVSNNYQMSIVKIIFLTIIVALIGNFLLIQLGYGLFGISFATLISFYFYGILIYILMCKNYETEYLKTLFDVFFRLVCLTLISLIILWQEYSLIWIWLAFFAIYFTKVIAMRDSFRALKMMLTES